MKYLILATLNDQTRYYGGRGVWHLKREHGVKYSASDAAMMKIAMTDNPQKFHNPVEPEAVPA